MLCFPISLLRCASNIATWLSYFGEANNGDFKKFTSQSVLNRMWSEIERPIQLLLTQQERQLLMNARQNNMSYRNIVEMIQNELKTQHDRTQLESLFLSHSRPDQQQNGMTNLMGLAICAFKVYESRYRANLAKQHDLTIQLNAKAKSTINTVLSIKEKATKQQKSDAMTLVRAACIKGDKLFKLADRLSASTASTAPASASASATTSADENASTSSHSSSQQSSSTSASAPAA
jgi:hypothetical protein